MQLVVPDSSSLLQTVQRLPQTQDIARVAKVIALRLLHLDLFFECAIDIGMRNVHRVQVQILKCSKRKDCVY